MGYIENIRNKIGHDPIFMPASGGIIIENNKILLQLRSDNKKWACHGGGLEPNESFEEALVRELKEELNIKVIDYELINLKSGGDQMHVIYPNGDEVYCISAFFMINKYEGIPTIDHDEVLELKWFDIDDLPENLHRPDKDTIKLAIKLYKEKNL